MAKIKIQESKLKNRLRFRVRFSEVDSMEVAWHGSFLLYLEDGRESFGKEFGIGYEDILRAGLLAPIVDLQIQYKQSLYHGEYGEVETRYLPSDSAKLRLQYLIYRADSTELVAIAITEQVFLSKETGELEINNPEFYLEWKRRWQI